MSILGKMKGLGLCDTGYGGVAGGLGIEYLREENGAGSGVMAGARA